MINGISSAISALKVFQRKMSVSANNIANIRTQGFKRSRSSVQEVPPGNLSTSSGISQVGRGTTIGSISQEFSQGSFETTSSPTDMAIGGDGFFVLRSPDGGNSYTRDGQFQFDSSARLVTSSGHVVQGWTLDPTTGEIQGAIGDIALSSFTSSPQETTVMTNIVNLDSRAQDNSAGANGLAAAWDGDNPDQEYIAGNAHAYRTSTKVFDGLGSEHDITVYFDKTGTDSQWEYMVTSLPSEDARPAATGDNLGLLARGILQFTDSGTVSNMTMEVNDGTGNWTPAGFANGRFAFQADFRGAADGSSQMSAQLDFGAFYNGSNWVNGARSSTQYSSPSNTAFSSADGYGPGDLLSVATSSGGVITGRYSNGEVLNLYQVAMAKFNNPAGLQKTGNNMYAQTTQSGDAITGQPRTNGMGSIVGNALEQSNVDIGKEMVEIILLQRGFEANLKVISTEDEMLGSMMDIMS